MKWNEDRSRQAYELALLGATDAEMANIMGCDLQTLNYWKRNYPEFKEAVTRGKMQADADVAKSLFNCAVGYEYKEDVIHVHKGEVIVTTVTRYKGPDAWAAVKWLSLRRRGDWSETHKVEVTNTHVNINKFDFSGMTNEELKLMAGIGLKQIAEHSDGRPSDN